MKITNGNKPNNAKLTSNAKNTKADSDEDTELTFEEILLKEKTFSKTSFK